MADPTALVIAGPTASGKSSLALRIAESVGAEIISADSRQVYRGMDIGTAKPTIAERERIPHHLIDILSPGEPYSAGRFLRNAKKILEDLADRDTPAIIVGGSTLYVHALVRGLSDLPEVPGVVADRLSDEAQTASGRDALYAELNEADPEAATTLDPTKSQRLIRFVGVLRTTGTGPSTFWKEAGEPGVPHRLVVLKRDREALYDSINRRVAKMSQSGLEAEARSLYDRGEMARRTMRATIGYREWIPVFESGRSREEAIRLIQRNSRRYAKRQMTWYRRYPAAVVLDAADGMATAVVERMGWASRM